ncbi:MAG TPA: outer membrane beta-barrel protein [Cytophagaceae bacterium]|jgi:hypothetical protein|nr:outer membrane beta-barrel protein [Cytophagaceae bacterium]
MRKLTLLILMMMSLVWNTEAQDSTAAAADDGKITLSGYLDTYYNHAFNNPQNNSLLGPGGAGRAFDRTVDQFSLGLVQIKTTYSSSKVDIVADLTFGPNAELGNFGNVNNLAYNQGGSYGIGGVSLYQSKPFANLYGTSAAIKQAYGTWKATSKLSFTVGQFGTHIGYEVIDAPINYHYSLSNLFNNGPFYHIGAKANYAFSDRVALMVGLVNNWDNLFDNNKQKSVIGQLYIKPVDGWNVYLNFIGGNGDDTYLGGVSNIAGNNTVGSNAPGNGSTGLGVSALNPNKGNYNRYLYDLTTGYQITSKFYVGLNAAYGYYIGNNNTTKDSIRAYSAYQKADGKAQNVLNWGGAAIYVNYAINDWLGIGIRGEHFEDFFGVRYIGLVGGESAGTGNGAGTVAHQKTGAINNSITITAPITLANGHFILKPEFRFDGSNNYIYMNSAGTSVKQQETIGMAAIFKW